MMYLLPKPKIRTRIKVFLASKRSKYAVAAVLDLCLILIILISGAQSSQRILSSLISPLTPLKSLSGIEVKSKHQVFGFAPYWNIDKLSNIDFNVLTTLAYFGVEIGADGNLVKDSPDYQTFKSSKATDLFRKAHANGTRVVLTLTQMKNPAIKALLDDEEAQSRTINQAVELVVQRGIDGLNIDIEYTGNPGKSYRDKFTKFVSDITEKMHKEVPGSQVTVSMYASSVKDLKIYDVAQLAQISDGIFMMAYDFAVASSDNAIPTSPLYGHKSGKYWYDISTAVEDFLTVMPSEKLILGLPWYGYNYPVDSPSIKAEVNKGYYTFVKRGWRSVRTFVPNKSAAQTYEVVTNDIGPDMEDIVEYQEGWDQEGMVGFKAYRKEGSSIWRIVFMEDTKSLGIKYDFARDKNLGGVGMWALGNDQGTNELWALLQEKFGIKELASNDISRRQIND